MLFMLAGTLPIFEAFGTWPIHQCSHILILLIGERTDEKTLDSVHSCDFDNAPDNSQELS